MYWDVSQPSRNKLVLHNDFLVHPSPKVPVSHTDGEPSCWNYPAEKIVFFKVYTQVYVLLCRYLLSVFLICQFP